MSNTVLTSNHLQGGPLDSNKIYSLLRIFYWKCLRSGSATMRDIYHIWPRTLSQIGNQLLSDKGGPCKIYTQTDISQIPSKMLCYLLLIGCGHHAPYMDLYKEVYVWYLIHGIICMHELLTACSEKNKLYHDISLLLVWCAHADESGTNFELIIA